MRSRPLISICIPTRDRVEILRETINSILTQNVDSELFEICVSDNSPTDETKLFIEKEFASVSNLVYRKTDCEGFLNSIAALKLGEGHLLKLHNDYSKFHPGFLSKMVACVQKYEKEKPEIFFAMGGVVPSKSKLEEYSTFDEFLNKISYYSTWSSAFSIWKVDFDMLMAKGIELDSMFPHTSLLFALPDKKAYVVDYNEYVENLPLKKKGGYNLVDIFVRIYLKLVSRLLQEKEIRLETYKKIEHGIIKFSAMWYAIVLLDSRFTFAFDNKEELIRKTCGERAVWKFYAYFCCWYYPKLFLKKMILRRV